MRFGHGWIVAALWSLAAGAAAAQEAPEGPPASAAEVRAAILGYELSGEALGAGAVWTECIDPAGRTLWRMNDVVSVGRLEVKADGQACFCYSETRFRREICWAMRREGERLRFDLVGAESPPLVVTARRKVASCPGGEPMA